jgi:hypothetical protein
MPSKQRTQPIIARSTPLNSHMLIVLPFFCKLWALPRIFQKIRYTTLLLCLALAVLLSACAPGLLSAPLPDVIGPAPTDAFASALAPSPPPETETAPPSPTPAPTLIPSATPTPTALPCRETAGQCASSVSVLEEAAHYCMYFAMTTGATRYGAVHAPRADYNDDQWVRLGIGTALDELIAAKAARPFLIVLPYEVDTFADPYADGYGKALLETLIPWIDAFHPTCAEVACRAIGGLSRGGAWSFLLALDHPELSGAAGGHSMVPFGGWRAACRINLRAMPEGGMPRLWIDTGKGDIYLPDLKVYEELLVQLEVPHEYMLIDGAHEEKYWSAHVQEYLRWYARGFPQE